MAHFKIVSTKEKRGIYLTVVLFRWEERGILYWPANLSHSQREKLRSDASSIPEEGWKEYPCVLKCSAISTFQEALVMEKKLTQCIDTDAEESFFDEMQKTRTRVTKSQQNKIIVDRNDLFLNSNFDQSNNNEQQITLPPTAIIGFEHMKAKTTPPLIQQEEVTELLVSEDETVNLNMFNEATTNNVYNEIIIIRNEINSLRNDFITFKNEIKEQIKDNNNKINLNLDRIFRLLSQNKNKKKEIETEPTPNLLQNIKFPLSTCEEISELEDQIRNNEEFRKQLVEFLSQIGGRTGVEEGSKIAYKVIDCVFKSEVSMQYSWTGVSRGTSGDKQSFQKLDGIIGVFFDVIQLADNRHTRKKNCSIFKDGVLKHAKKKTARKRPRPSSSSTTEYTEKNTENTELPSANTQFSSENTQLSPENTQFSSENTQFSSENTQLPTDEKYDIVPDNEES